MKRVLCWFGWHDWKMLRGIYDCPVHWSISWFIGVDADCQRCGKQWRDFEDHAERWHGGVSNLRRRSQQ